jgi:hypothetical protein
MVEYNFVPVNYPNDGPRNTAIDEFPDNCPYCHQGIHPKHIVSVSIGRDMNWMQGVYQCPRSTCGLIFIATYCAEDIRGGGKAFILQSIDPKCPKEPIKKDTIEVMSPKFYKIYTEALFADDMELKEICGPGYRKSLEFLVRDFIKQIPIEETVTKKLTLAQCINNYVEDGDIKDAASLCAWLGNDETHYYRKWENKDLSDLKALLYVTINFIDNKLTLKQQKSTMQKLKK